MSLKQVTKDIWDSAKDAWDASKPYAKVLVDNFMDAVNDVGYQASKYYTSSYTKVAPKIEITSPLEHVGACMRKAYQPYRYYGVNNPYAVVEKETPSRLNVNNKIPITPNTISRSIVEDEFNGISSEFDIQG